MTICSSTISHTQLPSLLSNGTQLVGLLLAFSELKKTYHANTMRYKLTKGGVMFPRHKSENKQIDRKARH